MMRYILRRLLHLIPTVFGVILITFVLFNLVGGSPGRIALGEKASVRQVDDFDETRGFNKPVLYGSRIRTLAYQDLDLAGGPGPWPSISNVQYVAAAGGQPAFLQLSGSIEPPLACPLRDGVGYEWSLRLRVDDGKWQDVRHRWVQGTDAGGWSAFVPSGHVEVASAQLRRVVANPLDSQLKDYLVRLAHLDFGISTSANLPVSQLLRDGIGPTLMLTTPILVIDVVVSVIMGLLCAFFRGRWLDRWMVFISVALMSVNYLVWIVVGQYLLGYKAGMFPVWGFESWSYLCLPVAVGVVSGLGGSVRFYRTVMLDEVYKDYVRTAYAKGLGHSAVLFRHVLRNCMVPIVTNVMLAIPFLYTGSLLLESHFGIPGVGYLSVRALNSSDPDVIRAVVLMGSILYVFVGLIGDILCAWFDPRIKLT